jgi:hypothetical protein
LSEIGIGDWQIVEEDSRKQLPLKTWHREGMSARTAANMLIDMLAEGFARAVYYRKGRTGRKRR